MSTARTVDDPAFAGPVQRTLTAIPRAGIARMESYWSTRDEAFVSRDRHATYVTVQFSSPDDQERVAALKRIEDRFKTPGMSVRFGGLTASSITFMKMVGVGLVIAIVVDATVVRGLLVPATMRLLGARAWWAPRPLARWWRRLIGSRVSAVPAQTPSPARR